MTETSFRPPDAAVAVVGIDPGRNIGVAYVTSDGTLLHGVTVTLEELTLLEFPPDAVIVIGDSTGTRAVQAVLRGRGHAFEVRDEHGSTLEGRTLYLRDHPPKGLERLLPKGMRFPRRAVDDYAAYALALRYLREQGRATEP